MTGSYFCCPKDFIYDTNCRKILWYLQWKEYLEERIASFKASCVGGSSLSKLIPVEPCIFHVCSHDAGFSNFFIVGILFQILLFPQKPAVPSNVRGSSGKCQRCAIFFDIKFCIREKFIPAESLSNFTWTRVNLPGTRSTGSNLKVTIVKNKKVSFNAAKQCGIFDQPVFDRYKTFLFSTVIYYCSPEDWCIVHSVVSPWKQGWAKFIFK